MDGLMGMDRVEEPLGEWDARPDFPKLLGPAAWERLPLAVRRRFAPHKALTSIAYSGAMLVKASLAGKILAYVCRLLDTPVAPFTGDHVACKVHVVDLVGGVGTSWERAYDFDSHGLVVVRSIKQLDSDGSLIEALGCGLRMRLRVFEDHGALHFVSLGYFVQLGSWRVPLPSWFPPGVTHVIHEDRGQGNFQFTMRTEHPVFGEMFFQSGIFQ